jgi:hypothetical protein
MPVLALFVAAMAEYRPPGSQQSRSQLMLSGLLLVRSLLNIWLIAPIMFADNADLTYPRRKKAEIVHQEALFRKSEKADLLVLVDSDPKVAVHTTLVNNHPRLDGPVVRAWFRPEWVDPLLKRYPERAVYVLKYDGMDKRPEWRRLRPAGSRSTPR